MNMLINDHKMEVMTNDLIYIMCNRIRTYTIEHPKHAPLEWKEPRGGAAQTYLSNPEKLFDPEWILYLYQKKEELHLMKEEIEKTLKKGKY